MKKLLCVLIIFLTSCTKNVIKSDFNFSENMSFNEFKSKLEDYAKNNSYPNIDD
tara:strand:- start:31 stop:192 length:162 start_codon:yes stop_codon:yes gene_type:complete